MASVEAKLWRFVLCEMSRHLAETILGRYHCGISIVLAEEIH
jgi:hypothetical protein